MINPYPATIYLSWKFCLLFTSAAYIQEHFRLDFIMEANNMNLDQTAPKDIVVCCKFQVVDRSNIKRLESKT